MSRMSFNDYAKLEPRLLDLQKQSKAMKDYRQGKTFCANSVWYGFFKPAISSYVGRFRPLSGSAELRSSEAYDTVYRHLYDPLPECNHEGGTCWSLRYDPENDRILEYLDSVLEVNDK